VDAIQEYSRMRGLESPLPLTSLTPICLLVDETWNGGNMACGECRSSLRIDHRFEGCSRLIGRQSTLLLVSVLTNGTTSQFFRNQCRAGGFAD
jgi:hypothetical protein